MKTTLFRPIGIGEYRLIKETNYNAFPPRLEWQPIFYPVMNQKYAEQIANDWNTQDEFSGYCGLVTSFEIEEDYLQRYPIKNVGGSDHNELWVPSEELSEFNEKISGKITVVNAFFGEQFHIDKNEDITPYYKKFK